MLSLLPIILPLLALTLIGLKLRSRQVHKKPLAPPGPRADPIIGHVRLVPASRPELTYMKWGKQYNTDYLQLNFLGQPVIVLNSSEAAVAILERRSANYSGRPMLYSFMEQGWSRRYTMAVIQGGVQMKKHRKMVQKAFTQNNCLPYREAQQEEARKLVKRIISTPEDWREHTQLLATTLILRVGYGIDAQDKDDPYVKIADKASDAISKGGAPGSTALDVFPFIRYLPSWFKLIPSLKFARECSPWVARLHEEPFQFVQQEMEAGTAKPSFVQKLLAERPEKESISELPTDSELITDADIKGSAGSLYGAGQDTTWSTLVVFVLSMVLNPQIQEKGKEELVSVLGHDSLPTFADRDKLPYVEYILQETFRWGPVVPLGIPHKSAVDDTYKDYFIPAGSLVVANAYAMNRDERFYSDPTAFKPDRYIAKEKGGLGEPYPIGHFGFGRRVCPGMQLGEASVWIGIATMLATLKFSKAKDPEGNEITPDPKWTTGITR